MTTSPTIPRMGRRRKTVDQSTYSGRVAVRLRELREKSGKSAAQVAKSLKIPASTYYAYENGNREFPLDIVPRLCRVLKAVPWDLFTN